MAISGARSSSACATPLTMLAAPGPRVERHTPGLPVISPQVAASMAPATSCFIKQEAHLPLAAGLHQLDQLAAGVADDERRARLLEGSGKHLDGCGHARSSRFPILAAGRWPSNLYEPAANVCGPLRNWPRRGPSPRLRAQRENAENRGEAPMRKMGLSLLTALAAAARARDRGGCAGLPHQAGAPHHSVPAGRQQRCGRAHDRHAAGRAARQAGDRRQSRRGGRRPRHARLRRALRPTAIRSSSSRSPTPSIPGSTSSSTIPSSPSCRWPCSPPGPTC